MAYCGNCGQQIDDGQELCASCAAQVAAATPAAPAYAPPPAQPLPADPTTTFAGSDEADAQQNKVMGILGTIPLLCFIPMITGDVKKSDFVRFHTNNGVVLFIAEIANSILWSIVKWILPGYKLDWIAGTAQWIISIGILVLVILGIVNAVNAVKKPLPVIDKVQIIKG